LEEKKMTTNHMSVSMWTEIDDNKAENLNGGGSRKPKPTVTITVKEFSTVFNQTNGGDGTFDFSGFRTLTLPA
jgi:hypothetical protein